MFDFRYHALSLAAVLLALAVGILIGVAIGDSNLVSSARDGIVRDLRSEVGESQHRAEQLAARLSESETLAEGLYPIAVHGLLTGRSIGLVFLGSSSDRTDAFVRDAVTQAGGNLKAVLAVREPLDSAGVAAQAAGTRYAALGSPGSLAASDQLTHQFGVRIGRQLIGGGQLLERVHTRLLSSYDGELGGLDGLVIVRSPPAAAASEGKQTDEQQAAQAATAQFVSGVIAGVQAENVPAVGVELSTTEPSQVPWYKTEDLASVDDLDTLAGRAALAFALAGDHGAFGVKPSADSLLPHVVGAAGQ